ncbi:MAG: hypothetical protein ACR2L2_19405 [Acidobacteriota bacterium]
MKTRTLNNGPFSFCHRVATMCVALLVFALLIGSSSAFGGAAQSPTSEPERSLFCGLWRVDDGFVSTIRIKNSLVVGPIEVTPVLYTAEGTEYVLPTIRLAATAVATVNINATLARINGGHGEGFGSAALRYRYPTPGHVLGSMEILNERKSLIFTYPFSGVENSAASQHRQTWEGLWWKHTPAISGFVNLSNTLDRELEVTLQAIGAAGTKLASQVVRVPGHASRFFEMKDLTAGLTGVEAQAGGLHVEFTGPHGALLLAGGLLNEGLWSAPLKLDR